MCLAIPGEVIEIQGQQGTVDFSGVRRTIDLSLVEGVKPGDYLLVHAGCAIQVLPPQEARETLKLFNEIFAEPQS